MQFLFVFEEVMLMMKDNKKQKFSEILQLKSPFLNIFYYNLMSDSLFNCVNCQIQYSLQNEYKEHYKSEHHRYNVKRKLIGLVPLCYKDYILQFQTELSSKSQSQSEIYCEVCSKKFMSPQTYKQHINSQKHKQNRKTLLNYSKKDKSETSSVSQFEVIGSQATKKECIFCFAHFSEEHLQAKHCFPPFKSECVNFEGLVQFVQEYIKKGHCIYCDLQYGTEQSVKQHMNDVGHNKLNIDNFTPFESFYLWKINQSSQEEDQTVQFEILDRSQSQFSQLNQETLQSLEEKRLKKIKFTPTGVIINGKEVGYRSYKNYYKQYLNRNVETLPRETQPAITSGQQWKESIKYLKQKPQFERIVSSHNHR